MLPSPDGAHMVLTSSRYLAASLIAGLLAVLVPTAAHASPSHETDFACRVNKERTTRGLPALRVASDLVAVARRHSDRMVSQNRLHHNANLTTEISGWRRLSENVGVGSSVASVHDAFMNSAGHRRNLLDPDVREMGLGVSVSGSRIWVTQIFRQPSGAVSGSLPGCTPPPKRIPLVGDWNGDGTQTPGWFSGGIFHLTDGTGKVTSSFRFGNGRDLPVTGDWNGDGIETIGLFRDGDWLLRNHNSAGPADVVFTFGRRGDTPVAGDWNGSGTTGIGVRRASTWLLRNAARSGPAQRSFTFGRHNDVPIVGDWNADGTAGVGVARGREWLLRNAAAPGPVDRSILYGRATDDKVTGSWRGSAPSTPAVVRDRTWILRQSNAATSGTWTIQH